MQWDGVISLNVCIGKVFVDYNSHSPTEYTFSVPIFSLVYPYRACSRLGIGMLDLALPDMDFLFCIVRASTERPSRVILLLSEFGYKGGPSFIADRHEFCFRISLVTVIWRVGVSPNMHWLVRLFHGVLNDMYGCFGLHLEFVFWFWCLDHIFLLSAVMTVLFLANIFTFWNILFRLCKILEESINKCCQHIQQCDGLTVFILFHWKINE